MKLVHVAAAVLNQIPLDWEHNESTIVAALGEAKQRGAHLVCFPELCVPGYGAEDAFYSVHTTRRSWAMIERIAPHARGMVVAIGVPTLYKNSLFNTACVLVDGQVVGLAAKRHLAGDGIYYEPRWFRPWPAGRRAKVMIGEREVPIGDLHFTIGGVKFGFEICEDAWVAGRPGSELALQGVDVILNPSASHFAFGKQKVRERFVLEGSRAFGVTYVYANLLGNEAGRAVYDGGAMIASGGELVARGRRFHYADWDLVSAVVDVDVTRSERARTGSYTPNFEDEAAGLVRVDFDWDDHARPDPPRPGPDDWEGGADIKEQEFTRAVALALFDYMRKSRSRGFVVSLSGGADSAAVSALSALAIRLARADLGPDAFAERLAYWGLEGEELEPDRLVERALLCAYQATENSGPITRRAASELARALGATYYELDIEAVRADYVSIVEGAIGRALDWDRDDITLQNIQARARSPSIWMFANLQNALLLSTSNRSEAAVGYATMDGDTSGGLSPIAGIDKAFLRRWLAWVRDQGPTETGPIPEMRLITDQQPTAELRPAASAQTDEGDLMPYELLDAIERAAIGEQRPPTDVWRLMRGRFPHYGVAELGVWVERFFVLWSRNQWKRERYAPSFHLDDQNLDPKTWCRWPILSGGFAVELAELRAAIREES